MFSGPSARGCFLASSIGANDAAGRRVIAFERAFCELEQKGLGRRDIALGFRPRGFSPYGLGPHKALRDDAPRATPRIAAPAFCKARPLWRLAISNTTILRFVRQTVFRHYCQSPVASADNPDRGCSVVHPQARYRSGDRHLVCGGDRPEPPIAQVGAAPVALATGCQCSGRRGRLFFKTGHSKTEFNRDRRTANLHRWRRNRSLGGLGQRARNDRLATVHPASSNRYGEIPCRYHRSTR
jgi:hypothetical protein